MLPLLNTWMPWEMNKYFSLVQDETKESNISIRMSKSSVTLLPWFLEFTRRIKKNNHPYRTPRYHEDLLNRERKHDVRKLFMIFPNINKNCCRIEEEPVGSIIIQKMARPKRYRHLNPTAGED